jgi:hypothetical protein
MVLPGHGKIIKNTAAVADHHLKEHEKRFKKIKTLLKAKPLSLIEISQKMFADAVKKETVFLVFSEVMGYLDWGEQEGSIKREGKNGNVTFRIV